MDGQQQDQDAIEPSPPPSHLWSDTTKQIVVVGGAVLGILILYRFGQLLPSLVIAIVLASVLNPVVEFAVARTGFSRTATVALLYPVLIILLALLPALLAPSLIKQVRAVDLNLQQTVEDFDRFLDRPVVLRGYSLELKPAWIQIRGALQDLISPMASRTVSALLDAVTSLIWLLFTLIISFYILKDRPAIMRYIHQRIPPHYRADVYLLSAEINSIWSIFFRGQLILCLVVGFVVGIAMAIVGLRNAVALGVLAGALELIPNIGPIISAIPAVLIALFQGSTYIPLPPFWFALLVTGLYILIQQVENNYLVPRIIGRSLNLHPLVVIVAVVAGANLAGVLGALLAAPTLASLRVLASYTYRKLLDLPIHPSLAGQRMGTGEEGTGQPVGVTPIASPETSPTRKAPPTR